MKRIHIVLSFYLHRVQRQMTNILIGKEKKFNERIRKLEDTLLDREKEIFELRSDQSMVMMVFAYKYMLLIENYLVKYKY